MRIGMKDFLKDTTYPDPYFPASTPEAEGMASAPFTAVAEDVAAKRIPLHSLLVIRSGRRVMELYGTDQGRQLTPLDVHAMYSTTKTVTGALIGCAISDGLIGSVRDSAASYFESGEIESHSTAKDRITIEHCLTMHSGLKYGEEGKERDFAAPCAARAFLSRPLAAEPGTRWNYSTADSQILSEILRRTSGMTPLEYARAHILQPLGIDEVTWETDGGGTNFGGTGLHMRPREIARFGWMMLCGGRFGGRDLVSSDWIKVSSQAHVVATSGWTPGESYGYHCWISPFGGLATHASMGQNMYMIPDKELLVAFTGALDPPEKGDEILGGLVRILLEL